MDAPIVRPPASVASSQAKSRAIAFHLASAFLLASFLVLGIRAIGFNGPTTDEPGHYRYGHRILRGVAARWDDSKMPVSALNALPCRVAEAFGSQNRDTDEFSGPCDWTLARFPTLLGGVALGILIAAWSHSLFGRAGALVSLGLFAFDPNWLAHSSLVTTDVFGALFFLLALRAFAEWLKQPSLKRAAALGLAVGLASISKYTAAYLPIVFLVSLFGGRGARGAIAKTRAIGQLATAVVIAIVVINIGFLGDDTFTALRDQRFESPQFRELRKIPLVSRIPLPVPRPFVEGLDRVFHRERNGGGSGNIYFLGELREPGSPGFAGYFFVVGFFKTPIGTVLALAAALIVFFFRARSSLTVDEAVLAATILVFVVYFNFIFRAQIGVRHFLVTIPPMLVLGGGLGPLIARSRMAVALAVLALLASASSVIRHGDDPLSYFNEFVSPTQTYTIAADSNLDWGQSRERVLEYLGSHPGVLEAPAKPFPGRILVGANQLTGVVTRKRMEWLRDSGLTPIGHVAFTHFLFDVTREDAIRLRVKRGDPPLP